MDNTAHDPDTFANLIAAAIKNWCRRYHTFVKIHLCCGAFSALNFTSRNFAAFFHHKRGQEVSLLWHSFRSVRDLPSHSVAPGADDRASVFAIGWLEFCPFDQFLTGGAIKLGRSTALGNCTMLGASILVDNQSEANSSFDFLPQCRRRIISGGHPCPGIALGNGLDSRLAHNLALIRRGIWRVDRQSR